MPYIGKSPDLNASVDTNELADDAVTLGKIGEDVKTAISGSFVAKADKSAITGSFVAKADKSAISGSVVGGFNITGNISGSATSTGSFGMVQASGMLQVRSGSEHGGTLTVVDIDLDHLANSHLAASNLGYPLRFVLGDAINYINDATLGPEGYDIYYLDGADENQDTKIGGNQQTLEQFKKIENTKSVVIVDDIEIKAVHLIEYLFKRNVPFNTHNVGNGGMITVDMRDSP